MRALEVGVECSECGMDVTAGDREQVKAHARAHRLIGEAREAGREFEPHHGKREARLKAAEAKLEAATADDARLAAMEEICRASFEGSFAVAVAEGAWGDHPDAATYAGGFDRWDDDKKLAPLWRKAHPQVVVPGLKKGWWTAPPPAPAPAERPRGGGRMGATSHGLRYRPAAGGASPSTSAAAEPQTGGLDDLLGPTPSAPSAPPTEGGAPKEG